ncbi:hypothetical protein [Proteiniclasticum sp.]|uniref:hypothetical protein n=1 Tax=Proteiniclasticum sp. TaxID=2053595 RepID=UPI0028982899|nr:hypothetical protein [Proteiniclasticum sp.]
MIEDRHHKMLSSFEKDELIVIIQQMANSSCEAEESLIQYFDNQQGKQSRKSNVEIQLNTHWGRIYPKISKANRKGGCSEKDEALVTDEVDYIEKLLSSVKSCSWKQRRVILDNLLEQVVIDNSPFTELLVDLSVSLCQKKEEHLYRADFFLKNANAYYKKYGERIYKEFGKD